MSGHKEKNSAEQPNTVIKNKNSRKEKLHFFFFFFREGICCNVLELSSHRRATALFLPHWNAS